MRRGGGAREKEFRTAAGKKKEDERVAGGCSPLSSFSAWHLPGAAPTLALPLSHAHTHTHTHTLPPLPISPPPRTEMSDAYKAKLRKEYLSLGGSPNTAMGGNYFLYIIILVAVLAVITKLSGAI